MVIRIVAVWVFFVGLCCLSMAKQNDGLALLQNIDRHNQQLEQVTR